MRHSFLLSIIFVITFLFSFSNYSIVDASSLNLKVHYLDVGQGDSILVELSNGKTMLIDGGRKSSGVSVVNYLKSKGIKKLDYVVATHPDADHVGGLIDVLESFKVVSFMNSGKEHTTETYSELLSLVNSKSIKYFEPETGSKVPFDSKLSVQVLSSNPDADDNNDSSIVLKLVYNKVSFLLMSDADTDLESKIMSKYNVNATVLKVGHHGGDTSTSSSFVSKVKPQISILSYGKDNSYNHPTSSVVNTLTKSGSKIYHTALNCNIVVNTDGSKYSVVNSCGKSPEITKPVLTNPINVKPVKPVKPVVKFKNCTEMRKYYPNGVSKNHASYELKHDRDRDGYACEK